MEQNAGCSLKGRKSSIEYPDISPSETPTGDRFRLQLLENESATTSHYKQCDFDSADSKTRVPSVFSEPLSIRDRFSTYLISATIVSTAFLLATTAFLAYLWNSDDSNKIWHRIVLANLVTRSVTLSAVILRITVSVQAGLVTSMLASLILEGAGICLLDVLEISFMRFANNGPHMLLWVYAKQVGSAASFSLLAALALSTFATQFTSTLLLSDIASISTPNSSSGSGVRYGFAPIIDPDESPPKYASIGWTDYGTKIPQEFPSFGEYSAPAERKDGVDDTGTVIRSLMPITDKDSRQNLVSYEGPAFAFDARVACTQPHFLSLENCDEQSSDSDGTICGEVAPRNPIDNAAINMNRTYFSCGLPSSWFSDFEPTSSPQWTLCPLWDWTTGGLLSALDPANNASLQHSWYPLYSEEYPDEPFGGTWGASDGKKSWVVGTGNAYLVLNTTTTYFSMEMNRSINATTYVGPWTKIEYPETSEIFSTSLCYDALPPDYTIHQVQDFNVTLSKGAYRREPVVGVKAKNEGFDTTEVRKQLAAGLGNATLEERGVFQLSGEDLLKAVAEKHFELSPLDPSYGINDALSFPVYQQSEIPTLPWVFGAVTTAWHTFTLHFCLYCEPIANEARTASTLHSSIFNEALQDTGSPAIALQAHLTTVLRQAYYTWLPLFDTSANATTVSYVERLAPVSRRGFLAVMGILATHVLVCGITTYLFLKKTKYSLLGNIWASFAQVTQTEQAQVLLKDGAMRTNKEVLRVLRREGNGKMRYRVAFDREEGVTLAPVARLESEG
ncbi:hypothetical protein K458DRAFT_382426 [Lentithecium fluviatile CBS 122367]|uniref:Uncharacterized protein n=1 Tax=Lentithecium fluviatile CBS 122367 TaxID=1168545 RepID=A0A6G1JKU3_9PLEO|nr:hypothetical protein K458DRAFT_382426 [Lentithecium fluviatile CBS 122367]